MKRLRIVFVIFFAMLIVGILYIRFLNSTVEYMVSEVSKAYDCVSSDYDKTAEHLEKISKTLDKNGVIYCTFINQSLLSDIDDKLLECRELYIQGNKDALKLSLVELRSMIDYLKTTEEFNLKKIM